VNGQEKPLGTATLAEGSLTTTLSPFQLRTFAVKLGPATSKAAMVHSVAVKLPYDRTVSSKDGEKSAGGFAADGGSLPAEMLPAKINYAGVQFTLAAAGNNAVTANGQTIALPAGKWSRVYVLAASGDGDQVAPFKVGAVSTDLHIENWGGYIGQWDYRTMKQIPAPVTPQQLAQQEAARVRADSIRRLRVDSVRRAGGDTSLVPAGGGRGGRGGQARMIDAMDHLNPGYIKPADIAWFASHHHDANGANQFYSYSYLFAYPIDVPAGATSVTLPVNSKIRVMAITVSDEGAAVRPARPLFDTLGRQGP
jgi:alpha-mannosidase